jgi:hypothetical protein
MTPTAPLTPESRRPVSGLYDSQTEALIDACHSKGIYSPVDLEAHEAAAIARYAEGHRRLLDKAGRYIASWVQPNASKEALLDEIEAAIAIPEAQEADRG